MAKIVPFRGIRYNPEKVKDITAVVTPPYDVISPRDQQAYFNRHPNNIIRLDLNPPMDKDTAENNPHTRAAADFKKWRSEGVLARDAMPALYLTRVDFEMGGQVVARHGMIVLVGLEPFEKRIILPHEKTFSKVKSERFDLMKACHANFSPVFSIYSDQEGIQAALISAAKGREPAMDIVDDQGFRHRMWAVTDPSVHGFIAHAFQDKRLFIADGHHRYETALNYRTWASGQVPGFGPAHPANFIMMYLCSMEDPGLVVLPAHRMLADVPESMLTDFIRIAAKYFDIETVPFNPKDAKASKEAFFSRLNHQKNNNAIGVMIKGRPEFHLLLLKQGMMERLFGEEIPLALRVLDVTVLTRLVLMEMLGFDQAGLDDEKRITYSSNGLDAVLAAAEGACGIVFLLNSTKIEQVKAIAEAGLIMPRKTTYFYPKPITGQVLNSLVAE